MKLPSHALLATLALCLTPVFAAPTEARAVEKRSSFRVERVANANFAGRDGLRELRKARAKFALVAPAAASLVPRRHTANSRPRPATSYVVVTRTLTGAPTLSPSVASLTQSGDVFVAASVTASIAQTTEAPVATAGQAGDVVNTPESGDTEYLSPIAVGGQTLNMDFDSGSANLWVFGPSVPDKKGHAIYDSSKSSTFKQLADYTWNITYGDGSSAKGIVGTDDVTIGNVTAKSVAIGIATEVTESFAMDADSDGLIGLAFSKLNTVKPEQQKTFMDVVGPTLAQNLWTASLRHNATGTYEFGRIDASLHDGDLQYAVVDSTSGFWQIDSSTFKVGDGPVMHVTESGMAGQPVIDTGSTLLLLPSSIVTAYYAQVPNTVLNATAKVYCFPCTSVLPDLTLAFGDGYVTIPGTFLTYTTTDPQGSQCLGSLQPSSDVAVWGDIFFKAFFVVFDVGALRVGVAPHAGTS